MVFKKEKRRCMVLGDIRNVWIGMEKDTAYGLLRRVALRHECTSVLLSERQTSGNPSIFTCFPPAAP